MTDPRFFFDTFVAPAVQEWRFRATDIRATTLLICQLDILAERIIRSANSGISQTNFAIERQRLTAREPMLALAIDIHDCHKHGPLRPRKMPRFITKDQRPEVHSLGGALGAAPLGAAPIGGTIDELVIRDDDGTRHNVRTVIDRCLTFLTAEMTRLDF